MNVRDILLLIENNRYNNEQVSIPYIVEKDGIKMVEVFTFDFVGIKLDEISINNFFRKFDINVETGEISTIDINEKTNTTVIFDKIINYKEIRSLYEKYYDVVDSCIENNISIEESNNHLSDLLPDSFLKIYKNIMLDVKENSVADTSDDLKQFINNLDSILEKEEANQKNEVGEK